MPVGVCILFTGIDKVRLALTIIIDMVEGEGWGVLDADLGVCFSHLKHEVISLIVFLVFCFDCVCLYIFFPFLCVCVFVFMRRP